MQLTLRKIPDQKNAHVYELLGVVLAKIEMGEKAVSIGISGQAGTGKTTLAENFAKYIGSESCVVVPTDDYILSREYRKPRNLTGTNPEGLDLQTAARDLQDILHGKKISKPVYDHKTGEVSPGTEVEPRPIVVVVGNAAFWPQLGAVYDIGYFLFPEDREANFEERVKRDVEKRGYIEAEARRWEGIIDRDYQQHLLPHKADADLVYSIGRGYEMALVSQSPRIQRLLNSGRKHGP